MSIVDQMEQGIAAIKQIKALKEKLEKQIPKEGTTADDVTIVVTVIELALIVVALEQIVEGL